MNADRWRRVEELFHAAQARRPQERSAFLDAACSDDAALRRELEELLAQPASADVFFAKPSLAAAPLISNATGSVIGQRIGGYRIDEAIGAGGMGEKLCRW